MNGLLVQQYRLMLLTKRHEQLRRQYLIGRLDIVATARKLGYRKASLTKGIQKVKTLLSEMGITIL